MSWIKKNWVGAGFILIIICSEILNWSSNFELIILLSFLGFALIYWIENIHNEIKDGFKDLSEQISYTPGGDIKQIWDTLNIVSPFNAKYDKETTIAQLKSKRGIK